MSLVGKAAVVIWVSVADDYESENDAWHSHEHLPERVGIPGFLRGRRAVAASAGAPRFFVIYEVRDPEVMTSPAYLERLNNPTPWSRKGMAQVRYLSRTLCRITASHGKGVGAIQLTVSFTPRPDQGNALRGWLGERLAKLAAQPGLVGANLLERDEARVRPDTKEERLRGRRDDMVDWLVLVEGYDAEVLRKVQDETLSAAALAAHGAEEGAVAARYDLAHVLASTELPST